MSTFEQSIPMVEDDAKASLDAALGRIEAQSEVCTVLVEHRFEAEGTANARVVLVFDDGKCGSS